VLLIVADGSSSVVVKETQRRSNFAFDVAAARSADYHYRAGLTRAGALLLILGSMVAGEASWWAWVAVAVAAVGVWQGVWLAWHFLAETEPRDPLVRWAWQSALDQHGHHKNNVAGKIDGVASVGLSLIGPFAMSSGSLGPRLVAFAAAGLFTSSAVSGAFLDPAFYNPCEQAPRWMERIRAVAGPALAGIGVCIVAGADWPPTAWPTLLVICALPLSVQVRLRESDRFVIRGARQAEEAQVVGRSDVVQAAHSMLSMPLSEAVRRARQQVEHDPDTYDLLRLIRSRFQELTALEEGIDVDADWPGVLVRPIEALCRPLGVLPEIRISVDELDGVDRDVARWALGDLVGNAVNAGAEHVSVALNLDSDGRTLRLQVIDDAGLFPPGTWDAPTGGLARLRHRLWPLDGDLRLTEMAPPAKMVTATWISTAHRG
jgi:hypothetical protein